MTITLDRLPKKQATALKRRAAELGCTPKEYLHELLTQDLELNELAIRTPLDEILAPIRDAMKGVSEEEIDDLVSHARADLRRKLKKNRRHGKRK